MSSLSDDPLRKMMVKNSVNANGNYTRGNADGWDASSHGGADLALEVINLNIEARGVR